MYLIGIKDGYNPLGNTGTCITHYKAEYKIREVVQRYSKMYSLDEVYGLQLYPQRLCELTGSKFVEEVRRIGKKYL